MCLQVYTGIYIYIYIYIQVYTCVYMCLQVYTSIYSLAVLVVSAVSSVYETWRSANITTLNTFQVSISAGININSSVGLPSVGMINLPCNHATVTSQTFGLCTRMSSMRKDAPEDEDDPPLLP